MHRDIIRHVLSLGRPWDPPTLMISVLGSLFMRSDMDLIQIKESRKAKLFSNMEMLQWNDLFFTDLLLLTWKQDNNACRLAAVHSHIHESVSQTGELRAEKPDTRKYQEIDKNSTHIIGNNEEGLLVYVSDRLCFVVITDDQKTKVIKAAVILRNKFVCTRS